MRARSWSAIRSVLLAAALAALAACGTTAPPTPVGPPVGSAALSSRSPAPSVTGPPRTAVAPSIEPGGPIGTTGAIAVLGLDGSLSLVDASGRAVVLADGADGTFQFPAWSPDGTRIASIRYGVDNSIVVFDAASVLRGDRPEPLVIFERSDVGPFYLSWAPDGRSISFLASENDALSLRLALADGSGPVDGSGPDAVVSTGNPFYFDWIAGDRLFAHVGVGPDALLGEIGLHGELAAPALTAPGDFRSVDVSDDGTLVGYVRAATAGASEVVVSGRDGGAAHGLPVFGASAVTFAPSGHGLATIGPIQPETDPFAIPIGPLRLLDGDTGAERTILDGRVLSFWWSPDARTLAALRVQPVPAPASSGSPLLSSGGAENETRLLFVDVDSGAIRSQFVVRPGQLFIDQVLSYFDQYALSHRLWSPDSASLLFPVTGDDGLSRIALMPAAGGAPTFIDGAAAFWSP
jgi:TolB protein